MKKTILVLFAIPFFVFSQQKNATVEKQYTAKGKTVVVYTTADNTNLRLTKTDDVSFKDLKQPFEVETCIFVNPNKKFQTFLGIGGAITDASAEVFAKLP